MVQINYNNTTEINNIISGWLGDYQAHLDFKGVKGSIIKKLIFYGTKLDTAGQFVISLKYSESWYECLKVFVLRT